MTQDTRWKSAARPIPFAPGGGSGGLEGSCGKLSALLRVGSPGCYGHYQTALSIDAQTVGLSPTKRVGQCDPRRTVCKDDGLFSLKITEAALEPCLEPSNTRRVPPQNNGKVVSALKLKGWGSTPIPSQTDSRELMVHLTSFTAPPHIGQLAHSRTPASHNGVVKLEEPPPILKCPVTVEPLINATPLTPQGGSSCGVGAVNHT